MTLDEKLREIIEMELYPGGIDGMIKLIKQAFTDEYKDIMEVQRALNSAVPEGLRIVIPDGYMTGQEWYERFMFEYKHETSYGAGAEHTEQAIRAARKAAGLK